MEENKGKKRSATPKSGKSTVSSPRRWAVWAVPVIIILFLLGMFFSSMPDFKTTTKTGPQFQKEGTLRFVQAASGKDLVQIDIEIADDDLTRTQGLMWRRSMEENQGMLFIMGVPEEQSFWMRNTYIPLDIIYSNDQKEIVKIRANTKPQSLSPITSERPAIYVVEVNAGFCNRHGIKEGDQIQFERLMPN